MRKTIVIAMATFGMTLLIMLGLMKPVPDQLRQWNDPSTEREINEADPEKQPNVTVIHVVVTMNDDGFQRLQQATERFERQRSDVDVELRNVNEEELHHTYQTQVAIGSGPDAYFVPISWVRYDAAQGKLAALDEYVSAQRQSQWYDTVLGAVRWNGYIWGVPVGWEPYVVVSRSDELEFMPELVSDLLLDIDKTVGGVVRSDSLAYAVMADLLGIPDFVRLRSEMSGLPLEENFEQMEQLLVELDAIENNSWDRSEDALVAVMDGSLPWAFVPIIEAVQTGTVLAAGREVPPLAITVPLPSAHSPKRGLPPFSGSAFVLSSVTKHAAEAADWVLFVTEQHNETYANEGVLPVRRSALDRLSLFDSARLIIAPPAAEAPGDAPPLIGLFEGEARAKAGSVVRFLDSIPADYGQPHEPPS